MLCKACTILLCYRGKKTHSEKFHYLQDGNIINTTYEFCNNCEKLLLEDELAASTRWRTCLRVTVQELITSCRVLSCIQDVLSSWCLTFLIIFPLKKSLCPIARIPQKFCFWYKKTLTHKINKKRKRKERFCIIKMIKKWPICISYRISQEPYKLLYELGTYSIYCEPHHSCH